MTRGRRPVDGGAAVEVRRGDGVRRDGAGRRSQVGEDVGCGVVELGSPTRGFVEEKATLNTFWELGDFSALLSLRYLSALTEQCVGLVADFGLTDFCSDPAGGTNKLDSQLYTDLQFGWSPSDLFGGGWSFALGVQNLTDEDPPICFSCDLNSLDGTIYPIAGQFWYVRAQFRN